MPERKFSAGTGYRYGFNGKEDDPETSTQDYGMRIYNPRIGKFLSVDPLTKEFAWWSPYCFAGNIPIAAVDLDGLEPLLSSGSTLTMPRLIPRIAVPRLTIPKPYVPAPPGEVLLPPPSTASIPSGVTVGQPKVEMSQSAPIEWKKIPPSSPEDLGEDWEDVTDPRNNTGSRDFENKKTGEKVRWDPAKDNPKSPDSWDGKNHWHRYNPNKTGKKDYYLDKDGSPVPKGSEASHIEAPKMIMLKPVIVQPEKKGFFRRTWEGIKKWWNDTNKKMSEEGQALA